MEFTTGPIEGVVIKSLKRHVDHRGWLMELFRSDETPADFMPAMVYISASDPGVVRGPHEHREQADFFCFVGPSRFLVFLWDNRANSTTFRHKHVVEAGEGIPHSVVIPAGVVHAYKNVGATPGWVINFPNRLYAGNGRTLTVDEIRHENDPNTVFKVE